MRDLIDLNTRNGLNKLVHVDHYKNKIVAPAAGRKNCWSQICGSLHRQIYDQINNFKILGKKLTQRKNYRHKDEQFSSNYNGTIQ